MRYGFGLIATSLVVWTLAACGPAGPEPLSNNNAPPTGAQTTGITNTMDMTDTIDMTDTMDMTGTMDVTGTMGMTDSMSMTDTASAELQNVAGDVIGTAIFTQTAAGEVNVWVEVTGFTDAEPGEHGIHVHQIGSCTPEFTAAGDHYNPDRAKHGLQNPEGTHAGDMPNIEIDEEGNATYSTITNLFTVSAGDHSILDVDGSALIIHANPDDQETDPSGQSGGRIACGVIVAGSTPSGDANESTANNPVTPDPIQGNNVQPALRAATPERIAALTVAEGFTLTVFARDLGNVRMMAQAEDGTVYATRRAQGDVIALRDSDEDGEAEMEIVLSGLESVHGILLEGGQMYLATPTTIYVASFEDGVIGEPEVLVDDLPDGGQHGNRTMAFGPDGLLYVSIGSSCNSCAETNPEHATILQIQPDGSSRTIFAAGLRNTIGWGWHPETGEMWGMDHGSDWRGDDQPPEELNRLEQDANYGWPWCFGDQEVDPYLAVPPRGMTKAEFCATTATPALTYQAHSAPIGMVFYTGEQFPAEYSGDAFVAMRGSWNRQEPVGYKVVRLDFEDGQPAGFEDFVTGWLIEDGQAQFGRVAGLLVLQDGSLLIGDDTNGMIYQVSYLAE